MNLVFNFSLIGPEKCCGFVAEKRRNRLDSAVLFIPAAMCGQIFETGAFKVSAGV